LKIPVFTRITNVVSANYEFARGNFLPFKGIITNFYRSIILARKKITVVGAGNVGAAAAHLSALNNLGDVVLLDIVEGLPQGKALDMAQSAAISPFGGEVVGTNDWADAAGSDVVIVTSGMPRKPGMSRDDLVAKNTAIVKSVTEQIAKHCPDSFIIVVCNPLDAMVYAAAKVSGFKSNKVMGMAGALDSARFAHLISRQLNVGIEDIQAVLMGGHGDDMVPLPRFTSVAGIPLPELMAPSTAGSPTNAPPMLYWLSQCTQQLIVAFLSLIMASAILTAPAAGA